MIHQEQHQRRPRETSLSSIAKAVSKAAPIAGGVIVCFLLLGCPLLTPVLTISPGALDFGLVKDQENFTIFNSGGGVLVWTLTEVVWKGDTEEWVAQDIPWLKTEGELADGTTGEVAEGTTSTETDRIFLVADRKGLAEGSYAGAGVMIESNGGNATITISLTAAGWSLKNVTASYSAPYLLEFDFLLRDENDLAVIAEPAQFEIECMEDATPIRSETNAHFAKGVNKQLTTYLVLDYTLSMADRTINGDLDGNGRSDALDKMEAAAKNVYLDALSEGAQVGIYEFHRGDEDPQRVAYFSTDKDYLKGRIDSIWTEYVKNFPAESRCWDALYAAVGEFSVNPEMRRDEQRAIVFLSDGRDESSTHTYQEVIDAAKNQGIAFYCIGFGAELDVATLQVITSQTGGMYYSATTVEELAAQFTQIVNDLGGHYILRWATLKRTSQTFQPSFTLHVSGHDLPYADALPYAPTEHEGNPLEGTLRMVSSDSATQSTAYLRAVYMPRNITYLSLYVESDYNFNVSLVDAGAGGLCDPATWTLTETPEGNGMRILVESEAPDNFSTALPFTAFGPILKFEFSELVDPSLQFSVLEIDDTLYSGGQTFVFITSPSVTMSSLAPDPTSTSPIPVTVTFSEVVTDFAETDIIVVNCTVGNFVDVGVGVYTFDLTPVANGIVTADIAAGVATNEAGNGNTAAATFSITYTAPPL